MAMPRLSRTESSENLTKVTNREKAFLVRLDSQNVTPSTVIAPDRTTTSVGARPSTVRR